jgi:hypothetical protein
VNRLPPDVRREVWRVWGILGLSGAVALLALWAAFNLIGGWIGIGVGVVVALVYLACVGAWGESDFGRLDLRALLRREAWSFHDPRRTRPAGDREVDAVEVASETDIRRDGTETTRMP